MRSRNPTRAPLYFPKAPATRACGPGSKIGLAVAAALAGFAVPRAPALAAEADNSSSSGLQEIVVTARKREENLQDVPLSIDVFTKKDMQNLAIAGFDDYAQKVPSISFISEGPGAQLLIMRGVSDGSTPAYSNTSATGFFIDDMSLSWQGVQPDLHLYDIERIEVLNGPQGTTFGASSMAGAIRYVTNKPDVNAFSAGVDFTGGQIQGAQQNWTYEGFFNTPIIPGALGLRISAFSDSHGGFINDELTTRTWINGTVSNNSEWARNDYNREHVEGGRLALKGVLNDQWSADLTYGFQRQATQGAWDEDPNLAPRTVERFGPESRHFEANMMELHVDGDVGIGDLVFASTYWSLPTRQENEYSEYIQNYGGFFGVPGSNEGVTCLNDPVYGTGPYTGCRVPLQYYEYHTNPQRWSDELRLASKPGGKFHWLGGLYWERTVDKNSGSTYFMPGLRTNSPVFEYYNAYNGTPPGSTSLPATQWYGYQTRSDYLQTTEFANISYDITNKLNVEAGVVHFHSNFRYYSPFGQFAYAATSPSLDVGSSNKWDSKVGVNYKITDKLMVYADFAQGFRDGGSNSGFPQSCYNKGVPQNYTPDTLNNYEIGWKSTSLNGRLIWNGAAYLMNWKELQTIIYDVDVCAPDSYYVNVGDARIYGAESNIDLKVNDNWAFQGAASYTDPHIVSSPFAVFQGNIGERLPYVPYFSWSWNLRYEHPLPKDLRGYAQFDIAHKGSMWDDFNVQGSNGVPRILQPSYSIMNLRMGLNPAGGHWLAELFITNLADKNAIVYTNTTNFDLRETTNEPRVYGLRLNYRFGKETNSE
jgi:outer membrane receptor protein involved in Fe transport